MVVKGWWRSAFQPGPASTTMTISINNRLTTPLFVVYGAVRHNPLYQFVYNYAVGYKEPKFSRRREPKALQDTYICTALTYYTIAAADRAHYISIDCPGGPLLRLHIYYYCDKGTDMLWHCLDHYCTRGDNQYKSMLKLCSFQHT